jgi:hypothetical protein
MSVRRRIQANNRALAMHLSQERRKGFAIPRNPRARSYDTLWRSSMSLQNESASSIGFGMVSITVSVSGRI